MVKVENGKVKIGFGKGDIAVTSALIEGNGIVVFENQEPNRIGGTVNPGYTFETLKDRVDAYIEFEDIKSLEVVILKLQQARAYMLGRGMEESELDNIHDITAIYEENSRICG